MGDLSERVLVLSSTHRDSESTIQILSKANFEGVNCANTGELLKQLRSGAGLVILAKEVLTKEALQDLSEFYQQEPSWSFMPIIILIAAGDLALANSGTLKLLEPLRNITLLERPVRIGTLTSVVRSVMADRRRQYGVRDLLAALEQSRREAVQANQAKSAFLANMSHEIRTPLGVVLGFSEFLTEANLKESDRDFYLSTIRRNGKLLSALIDDILDLAKVESGKIGIETIKISLGELISEVMWALKPAASSKNIDLRLEVDPSVPRHINTDPLRLKQILNNIVGNAIKFTQRGQVHIRVYASASASGKPGKQVLHFEVTDTGVGMLAEDISHLFQPFVQADSSITRKYGGTGLGLVLSKKLAEALGGNLILNWSVPGKGSQFAIVIDITGSAEAASELPALSLAPQPITSLKDCRVLLVEDSQDNQILIGHILSSYGALVKTAGDGVAGVEAALKEEFDVVLMDIQMPKLGGREATQRLRSHGFQKPIIALTAHALKEDKSKCLAVGCNFYLTKPVQRNELVNTIRHYWNGSSYA